MKKNRLTTAELTDRLCHGAAMNLSVDDVDSIVFALVTDPEMMDELIARADEWREEMEATHPDA